MTKLRLEGGHGVLLPILQPSHLWKMYGLALGGSGMAILDHIQVDNSPRILTSNPESAGYLEYISGSHVPSSQAECLG